MANLQWGSWTGQVPRCSRTLSTLGRQLYVLLVIPPNGNISWELVPPHCHVTPLVLLMRLNYPVVFPLNQITYVGEDDSQFFTELHGRRFNALSQRYMLPADDEETRVSPSPLPPGPSHASQRSELQHKMLQFLFGGKNYVGPVQQVLVPQEGRERCRVLDLGTGAGFWCVFPKTVHPSFDTKITGPSTWRTRSPKQK